MGGTVRHEEPVTRQVEFRCGWTSPGAVVEPSGARGAYRDPRLARFVFWDFPLPLLRSSTSSSNLTTLLGEP